MRPNYYGSSEMNQQLRLKHHLLIYGTINPLQAWEKLGIYRLSDTVYKLRKQGWHIETKDLEVKNQFGEKCVVAEYVLQNPFTEL